MDFGISGSRPPSARRPQSRTNPITGVEMPHSGRDPRPKSRLSARRDNEQLHTIAARTASRSGSRPDGVPSLDLAPVIGRDEDIGVPIEVDPHHYNIESPGSASTVSWGTPSSASVRKRLDQTEPPKHTSSQPSARAASITDRTQRKDQRTPKIKQPTAWDRPPCPEDLPPPSDRYQQKYKEYEKERKEAYKNKGHVSEAEVQAKMAELQLKLDNHDDADEMDDPRDLLQKEWVQNPYNRAHSLRKMDVEELEMIKKRNKLIETVMIDQLSRGVLSDPEQDTIHSGRRVQHTPGMHRGAVRTLHDSKVATSGTATEKMLSRRVRFGARILSENGRDAVRELMGFFFQMDHSLTIYEYKVFGKTAKALPFINRGVYRFVRGRRKGDLYELPDIAVGSTLYFDTKNQPLPDSVKARSVVAFRVTDLDDEMKENILLEGVAGGERRQVWERLHALVSKQVKQDEDLLQHVQGLVRRQLRTRGVKVRTGLRRLLRSQADSHGCLNKYDYERALIEYRVDLDQSSFDELWGLLDSENSGYLDYGEFMRHFLGEMSETRKELVRKAYTKIDTTRKGIVAVGEMAKFYKANFHPKVISGELDEQQMTKNFLSAFEGGAEAGYVTYQEFEEYYEGISLGVRDDEEFANILRNAWRV